MNRNKTLAYILGTLMMGSIAMSCTQDDTMDELMSDIELAQPSANDHGNNPPPPPPGD